MKLNLPALDEDDEIDITPMIDCVFLLVLFFMVTSSFIDEPKMDPTPYTLSIPAAENKTYSLNVTGTYLLRERDREIEVGTLAELLDRIRAEPETKFRIETRAEIRFASDTKVEDANVVPLTLPTAENPKTIRRDQADILTVPREGAFQFHDQLGEHTFKTGLDLVNALQKRPAGAPKRPVILRADAKCTYQQVVQARNALRLAGIELIFEEVEVRHGNAQP